MEPGERVRSENGENWKISSGSDEKEEENIQNKKNKKWWCTRLAPRD